jgi:hypothetical protein
MKICRAQPADAEAIARTVNLAFLSERFFINEDRTSPEKVSELFQQGTFLLAKEDRDAGGMRVCGAPWGTRLPRLTGSCAGKAALGPGIKSHDRSRKVLRGRRLPLHGSDYR